MNDYKLRSINLDLVKYYEINLKDISQITLKSYKLVSENNNNFFLKETSKNILNKYHYLENIGISNILYPILNKDNKYVSSNNNQFFYITDFINEVKIREDVKSNSLFYELENLHNRTIIKKTLDPFKARNKFDEISNQLDYKYKIIESYIRQVESKPLNMFSMPVLENYHIILDAKKELIKLQKRIISSIKSRESVNYNFIHNNPSLDHILNVRGQNYLISLDKSKIGLDSLDYAKYYINNNHVNIDYKSLITNHYNSDEYLFNYIYFRYLVLYIYLMKINFTSEEHINSKNFENIALKIGKYFNDFSDNKE